MSKFSILYLQLCCWSVLAITAGAQTAPLALDPVVITSARPADPLTIVTDPRAAAQPVPAHDGADVLKNIPGFNVIRKGGTDGDPVFRGMAGSRLGILVEGECVLGGCGNRMDPPTAYIFPAAFDRITVIKGPQAVRYGPVSPAGSVRFERDFERREETGQTLFATTTVGDFGRWDGAFDLRGGTQAWQGRVAATYATMDDYVDGSDQRVHSAYERWSTHLSGAWSPSAQTFLELTGSLSDGEAAYADRMMDGVKFDRQNLGLRLHHQPATGWINTLEAQVYVNDVDHVMDNFSLREFRPSMMMPGRTVSNPDRLTYGGRVAFDLAVADAWDVDVGFDHQSDEHRIRRTMNEDMMPFASLARSPNATFHQTGAFIEAAYSLKTTTRLYGGLRADHWAARDQRATVRLGMRGLAPNPTADQQRTEVLPGAFTRIEHDLAAGSTVYVGIGHTQRFPDYWELIMPEGAQSVSGFDLDPEATTQVDLGWLYPADSFDVSVSAFANQIEDYILIQRNVPKPGGMMGGMRRANVARNVNAQTYGGEMTVGVDLTERWRSDFSLTAVHGTNETDDLPLAQMPPLEGRLGLTYQRATWSTGLLWRIVAAQDRVAVDQGNIVGQDLGPSPAFDVVSINASWAPTDRLRISAGIDNLFDTTYAEHISRGGSPVAGFIQTTRVNEPGRFLWLKCDFQY